MKLLPLIKTNIKTKPRVPKSKDPFDTRGMVSPMNRYPGIPRNEWSAGWKRTACIVKAEDEVGDLVLSTFWCN